MSQEFNYKSTVKNIQNKLISQSLRDSANLDFLKSEEALTEIIKSYKDRFQTSKGMLFDSARYVASSAQLIRVEDFNEMFESLYIDMSALYNDLDNVDKILKLNLGRNKNYFLVIKKRLRDLWNKLHLTRLLIYDDNPSDESYYESFSTKINAKSMENLIVDKKSGLLHLAQEFTRTHTYSSIVKNVKSVTYPEHNDFGGIKFTTSELNSYKDNYTNGPRDMLGNGLWKEQILCNDVPDIVVNIGSAENIINRNYKGIVSIVDIEYVYPVEVNRFDIDVFGDMLTKIDCLLYRNSEDDEWTLAYTKKPFSIPLDSNFDRIVETPVKDNIFDIKSFFNISTFKAKYLRLVLNQENYVFLDSKDLKQKSLDEKIQEDLSERRYSALKFGSDLDDILLTPTNDENKSLYYRILDIIESTVNVEDILNKIDDVINPKVNVVAYDYERTAKFEIGAWSIEPKIERYTQSIGKFSSMNYALKDKSLTSVALITSQTTPCASTANWYIGVDGKNIPIIENNKIIRKEPLYPVNMRGYQQFSSWSKGTFFLLDFPLDGLMYDSIYLSVNGSEFIKASDFGRICFFNSRLIYIDAITDPFSAVYTIQYPVALRESINLYVLKAKTGVGVANDITLDIVASRADILNAVIAETRWKSKTQFDENGNSLTINDLFGITSAVSTIDEARSWFGSEFNTCVFIGDSTYDYFNGGATSSPYKSLINGGPSKTKVKYSDVLNYVNYTFDSGFSDLALIGSVPNLAPLSATRSI